MNLTIRRDESLTDRVLAYQETKNEKLLANILDEIRPLVVHIVKNTLRGNSVDYVLYEDASQEAMLDIVRAVGSFRSDKGSGEFKGYAQVVIKNAALAKRLSKRFLPLKAVSSHEAYCKSEIAGMFDFDINNTSKFIKRHDIKKITPRYKTQRTVIPFEELAKIVPDCYIGHHFFKLQDAAGMVMCDKSERYRNKLINKFVSKFRHLYFKLGETKRDKIHIPETLLQLLVYELLVYRATKMKH